MAQQSSHEIRQYLAALDRLYSDIRKWIGETSIMLIETPIEITEEQIEKYDAPGMRLLDEDGRSIAAVQPVGTKIIGADGRVDFIGDIGRESVVWLQGIETPSAGRETEGEESWILFSSIYKGVTTAGWYWIEDSRRSKANLLDRDVFWEIVAEVSDYEYGFESAR